MDWLLTLVDIFLHLDKHLGVVLAQYGTWTHVILFLIIFCETGLVVTPILPGDSLLFAAGAFAATGSLSFPTLMVFLSIAAVLGDAANYSVGRILGPRVLSGNVKWLKTEYLDRTHRFYEKYGGKTIVIARFVPIVRTFAPFLAGVGLMSYGRFVSYNVFGGILWITVCLGAGYQFGNLDLVKNNFSLVILVIVFISILPGLIELGRKTLPARHG